MFARFLRDDTGATAIEYALIAATVGLVVAVAAQPIGTTLSTFYGAISTKLGSYTPN
jgi:pilus assembly protein Flp/PilA